MLDGIRSERRTPSPQNAWTASIGICNLNNLIEQDHRGVKLRIGPMLGFKWFTTAAIVIAGIELLRRIHKGQFSLGRLRLKDRITPAVWNAVLAA